MAGWQEFLGHDSPYRGLSVPDFESVLRGATMPEQQELTYADVIRFLVQGLKFALAAAVAAGAVAFVLSERMQPQYEAAARLLLTPPNQEVRNLLGSGISASALDSTAYQEAATTESVLLESLAMLGVASPSLEDASGLEDRTNVTYEDGRNSSIISIKVTSDDPLTATSEANAIAESLLAWERGRTTAVVERSISLLESQLASLEAEIVIQRLGPDASSSLLTELVALRNSQHDQLVLARSRIPGSIGSLEMFQAAVGPAPQTAPRPVLYSALAGLAGLIAAYAVLLVGYATNTRIRSLDELAHIAGVPVLAAYGKGFLNGRSRDPDEALAFLAARLAVTFQRQPAKILVLGVNEEMDTKELSLALAKSFAEAGRRVLFVSSDLRRPLASVGYGQQRTQSGLRGPSLEQLLLSPGLDLQPNSIKVGDSGLDVVVPGKAIGSATKLLAKGFPLLLRRLQRNYQVVVVDAAPLTTAPDALTIAPNMSGILLVVRFPGLERETISAALAALGPLRRAVAGVVALDVPGALESTVSHGTVPLPLIGNEQVEVVPRAATD